MPGLRELLHEGLSDNSPVFVIQGIQVTRILDSIALFRGYPATIRTDLGSEFICLALGQCAFEHGIELLLIQPGKAA